MAGLRLEWIPLIGLGVFLLGAFLTGVLNYFIVAPEATLDPAAPASNWAEAGANALFGAAVIGFPALVACLVRYLGVNRFERRKGRPRWFVVLAVSLEAAFALVSWVIIWAAVTPRVDAGFLWIPYFGLSVIWFVLSFYPFALAGPKPKPEAA